MPISKLKNIAILVLLAANLILLALLVPNRIAQENQEAEMRDSLSQLYAGQGIDLDGGIVPQSKTLYVLQIANDSDQQVQAVTALLGEHPVAQATPTGYVRSFQSSKGSCGIGRGGAFQATLNGLEKEPDSILEEMGFRWNGLETDGEDYVAVQEVLGMPVFSDGLRMVYENGLLTDVEGTFFFGTDSPVRVSQEAAMSAADALVLFLDSRYHLGWVGSAVVDLEQGYVQADTASAANVQLTPVWKLVTDTNTFMIDGMTGEIMTIS